MREREKKKLASADQTRAQLARLSQSLDMPAKTAEKAYFEASICASVPSSMKGTYRRRPRSVAMSCSSYREPFCSPPWGREWSSSTSTTLGFSRLHAAWAYPLLQRLPPWEPAVWLLSALAALYISHEFLLMKRVLEQPEPSRTRDNRS